MADPAYAVVGMIRNAQGIRGEVVVEPITDAPDEMFSDARALLGEGAVAVADAVAALHSPLNPNCYLSPTDFSAKFARTQPLRSPD